MTQFCNSRIPNLDKIDVNKRETAQTRLSRLSNVVKSDVVKNSTYDGLVKKVNTINSNKLDLEIKIEDTDTKIPLNT